MTTAGVALWATAAIRVDPGSGHCENKRVTRGTLPERQALIPSSGRRLFRAGVRRGRSADRAVFRLVPRQKAEAWFTAPLCGKPSYGDKKANLDRFSL